MSRFVMSNSLVDKIHHYASFPQTGVSLQVSGSHLATRTALELD
jgi:hypothetical protein